MKFYLQEENYEKVALLVCLCIISTILLNSISVLAVENEEPPSEAMPEEMLFDYLAGSLYDATTYSSEITSYDNFMIAYYDNLTYNYGVNYKNSCGYIALGMILSYYDTYLYDGIIPEQYDAISVGTEYNMISRNNSPGIVRDIIESVNNPQDMTANDYYSVIQSMSDYSLHAKLITIGNYYGNYDFNDNEEPAITNIDEREQILNTFLLYISNIDTEDYSITKFSGTTDDVKSFTISAIQSGHPVLLSVAMPNSSTGHAVVAYDYDPETYEIYCHWGFGADQTHINPEDEDFTIFNNAMIIDFNLEHSHSDNYGVTTITNDIQTTEYYCYDDCRILTYQNLHSYDSHCDPYTATQHKAYCECGEYILSEHGFNASSYSCLLCWAPHTHDYTDRYVNATKTMHRSYCICGANCLEPHVVESGSYTSGNKYALCIVCKALVTIGMTHHQSIGELPHSENGSFILPDGIIVLVDEDIEAYFNGTLEFV